MRNQYIKQFSDENGTAIIEFALVVPVFLTIVLGILGYGIYLGAVHSVAQLAADAARASVAGLSDGERATIANQQVQTNLPSYPMLSATKVTVAAGPLAADPTEFQVTVTYDARSLPIYNFSAFLSLPPKSISRSATVKRGGY